MTVDQLTCDVAADRGMVERYVAGRLGDPDLAAFEAHLLTCERCRDEVRLGFTVRAELGARTRQRTRRNWLWGGGLALAAGLAALVLFRPDENGVRALGAVREPPVYLGVAVRGTPARADMLFDAAMTAYSRGDYALAASGLERSLAAGADSVPVLFFLGASRLAADRATAAAHAFRRVIALGDSPYRDEAHYYLAKALLRDGKAAAALHELEAGPSTDSALAGTAKALADSIRGLSRR